ncbi:hypothetical protein [Lampropedia aestuarii]|uniref:hypothetical protein n=1 Tax=Lampropedia aestuarii TaxID=2562762 RepID=UPI002468AF52|nr:hypothetical protein [Lampropedia aestuarii]MDH5855757.1 hypothetical protein [Lampropedia aestuarii]
MPLKVKRRSQKSHIQANAPVTSRQQGKGLTLAVTCAADVSDPQARHASVWLRIKETTAFHWGMAGANQAVPQPVLVDFKPICHRATVWFAN